jgi:hypothetical protein
MTGIITEMIGQGVSGDKATRVFTFFGFRDAVAVDARIKQFRRPPLDSRFGTEVPFVWAGLFIDLPCQIEELGGRNWRVTATYGRTSQQAVASTAGPTAQAVSHGDKNSQEPVGPELEYSTVSGTQTIYQSYKTLQRRRRVGESGNAPDLKGVINPDPVTGEVKGCERLVGSSQFTLSLAVPNGAVTGQWLDKIDRAVFSINETPWFGFLSGEALLMGIKFRASGSSGQTNVSLDVGVKRNRARVEIIPDSDELFLADVEGWSHVWVRYDSRTLNGRRASVPVDAYEERIYPRFDFNQLGFQLRAKPRQL